jgi:hypothetical protein
MPTITTRLIQTIRDSILIYEVGRKTQEINSAYTNGVSIVRLTKSLAAILRHWELLRKSTPELKSINYWETLNAPFRYGQVIYQKIDPGDQQIINDYNVLFLTDIVKKSKILEYLKVNIRSGNEFDKVKSKIIFPKANSSDYGVLIQESGMEYRDVEILRELAIFYSNLKTEEIATLSTCPTYDDCKRAIVAEIVLWLHDIEKLIRLLKDFSGGTPHQIPVINKRLNKAFECGRQIGEKIEWYLSLEKIQNNILRIMLEKDFSKNLIVPLSNGLRIGSETEELINLKRVSKILTGYLSVFEQNVNLLSPSISLPNDASKKARDFVAFLPEAGVKEYDLEELYLISGKRNLNSLVDLIDKLEAIFNNNIVVFLATSQLPNKYDRRLLFPD